MKQTGESKGKFYESKLEEDEGQSGKENDVVLWLIKLLWNRWNTRVVVSTYDRNVIIEALVDLLGEMVCYFEYDWRSSNKKNCRGNSERTWHIVNGIYTVW
jgi:hypothetical protein